MTLRIRTISRMTGIRETTLRAWERRYGFPTPMRAENNYRTYSREEVEAIRRVASLMAEGLLVSEAIAQVRARPTVELPPLDRLRERFWSAILTLEAEDADRALSEAQLLMPPGRFCDEVLMPLLREMSDKLDVAREHLASSLVRHRLRLLLQGVQSPAPDERRVLLACPPQDHHEGGLLALALHLRMAGCWVSVLGADTPVEALEAACHTAKPSLLALSFVLRREPQDFDALLRRIVTSSKCLVVAGGPAAREHLKAVFAAGAQYAESAAEVLALCEQTRPQAR